MTVFVVVLAQDRGKVAGVFSSSDKAAEYIAEHPYNAYLITEHTVDRA